MSRDWTDEAAPMRSGEELDCDRLLGYLDEHLPGSDSRLEIEQFPSGFSNLTYLLRWGTGDDRRNLVLRRPPFGSQVETAHDMAREYRILSGLRVVYPRAPRPLLFCDDATVLGAPFYVMERREGVILRSQMPAEMQPSPPRMAAIADSLVEALAELHEVDVAAAGLGDFGRPDGYVGRQIEGWTRRWQAARTDEVPAMETVAEWLKKHQPVESDAALIHNDFKYDNLVLDPDDWSRVTGVLDWEMATVGDPLMDLGTTLGYWVESDDPPAVRALALSPTTLAGNPSRAEVVASYAERSGRKVAAPIFYYAFGVFKIAVIIQQIYYRFSKGLTTDPRFAGLGEGVRGCALMARQAIDKGRLDRLFEE